MPTDFNELLEAGIAALGEGESQKALALLELAKKSAESTTLDSCLAYCLARERGQVVAGIQLCTRLIQTEPNNLFHYLNLGRILLLAGQPAEAIDTFRQGIQQHPHPQLIRELDLLGVRRPRIIGFLARSNPLNKVLGHLFNKRKLDSNRNRAENT